MPPLRVVGGHALSETIARQILFLLCQHCRIVGAEVLRLTDPYLLRTFGAAKATQQGLTYEAVVDADSVSDSTAADDTDKAVAVADSDTSEGDTAADDDAASSHWSVVKFVTHDKDGRYTPTRQGNRSIGWVHFSGPPDIHSEKVIKAAVNEHPERGSTKTRKVYGAVLYDTLGITLAKVKGKVIAQYHWETSDHRYKLADTDDEIGVITTFCQGVSTCPDALNRV
ncbi:hypothetical protein GCM10011578_028640 [Streptomyces fuscichromogenes]|uniref:Uncharacterized protein n=1 Tax=Streptomyces fuscichromogenes TaxID=1324013 RepID=A0A918CR69_9ACTN|nr:hypothetical protein GCM10011578_028640 [Streptomyces fuscichromogenes]